MKLLKLSRTIKEGFSNFWRNGFLSVATVSILIFSLFIMAQTTIEHYLTELEWQRIQDKLDVSVYFNPDVEEQKIIQYMDELKKYQEVKEVTYISREQALENFLLSERQDPTIKAAIDEIGSNPLLSALVIKAHSPEKYELISESIKNGYMKDDVDRVNYDRNKEIIAQVNAQKNQREKAGLFKVGIFAALAILITFNAVRITIYSHRKEFEIMRLIGASNLYVRMPYIFEGMIYGTVAGIITMFLLFINAQAALPLLGDVKMQNTILQNEFLPFYREHFLLILGILILSGITLGVVSSYIAARRYLKI